MPEQQLENRLAFLQAAERLKDTLRSAHTSEGRVESVAEHTWRLMLMACTLADLFPKIDLLRLLKICVLHDLGEAIDGDVPAPLQDKDAPKSDKERRDMISIINCLPTHVRDEFLELWDEYENVSSEEAKLAKALDKIETILQHNQGKNPSDFDYGFNVDYGRERTDANSVTKAIRKILDEQTMRHMTE